MYFVMICRALRDDTVPAAGTRQFGIVARESPRWGFVGPFESTQMAEAAAVAALTRGGCIDARILTAEQLEAVEDDGSGYALVAGVARRLAEGGTVKRPVMVQT